jgi:hypothetical protein
VVLSRTGVDTMSEQYFTRPNVQPVITNIGTTPEQRQMSTSEFKAKFDEMTVNLQNYIKETLLTELDAFKHDFMTHGKIEYVYIPGGTQTKFDVPLRTSLFFVLTENNDNKTTIINVTRFGTGGLVYQTVVSGTAITIHTNADKSAVFLTPTFSVRGFVVRARQPI